MFLMSIWTGSGRFNGFFKSQERSLPKNVSKSNFCHTQHHLGFLAKLNLADFGPNSLTVNRVIEGGFGLSYSFSREFSVGFALERVGGSRIRNNFVENEIIYVQGDPLLNLDPTDDNINVEDNYTALSFSWIYGF